MKPSSCDFVEQDGREPGIVFDDQDHAVVGTDRIARVAADLSTRSVKGAGLAEVPVPGLIFQPIAIEGHARVTGGLGPAGDRHVIEGNEERERASLAHLALNTNLASQQAGDFPADRKAQPGAAVLAAGAGIGLLKRLEDDSQLVRGDADTRIADGERDDAARPTQDRVLGTPAAGGEPDVQIHVPALGEFEGVRQQIPEHLLQPLHVGGHGPGKLVVECDAQAEAPVFRDRAE